MKIHQILDCCARMKTKVVIAGTNSYLFNRAMEDSALDRLNLVHFVPILYKDIKLLNCEITFDTIYRKGILLTEFDVINDLLSTIKDSVYLMSDCKNILKNIWIEDFILATNIIVEYIMSVRHNILPAPSFKLNIKYYDIENKVEKFLGDLPCTCVSAIYNILIALDIIRIIPRIDLSDNKNIVSYFYLSLPTLYYKIIDNYEVLEVYEDKYDIIFEATAITQILGIIERGKLEFEYFSIKDSSGSYEIDLCLRSKYDNTVLNLIKFKLNSSKGTKHFYNEEIIKLNDKFKKINKYIVYSVDESNLISNKDKEVKKISIEDFLANLEEYLK